MLITIIFWGFIGSCVLAGVVQYIKNPKPPKYLTYNEYRNYYKHKEWLTVDSLEDDNSETQTKLYKELEYLTAHKDMLEDLQRLIEDDLHNSKGNTKANLSRLISLDKQVHTTQQKIDKIKEELS